MINDILDDARDRMHKSLEALDRDLGAIRTGRANPALVEHISVNYGGGEYSIQQLAQITTPEARLLVIQPWDPKSIAIIEKAILASDLGITPNNDGKVIRLAMPPLTEERRKDLVRVLRKRVEEAKVAVRNVRRDAQEKIRRLEKDGSASQDESHRSQDQLQKLTDDTVHQVDASSKRKEEEVMAI